MSGLKKRETHHAANLDSFRTDHDVGLHQLD
jgi:hypothetical protein